MPSYLVAQDRFGEYDLIHYGVLGMKWGVRKNPQKATAKATKKLGKYYSRFEKNRGKAIKNYDRASRKSGKKNAELMAKGDKYSKRANKALKRGERWFAKMNKILANKNLSALPAEAQNIGRQIVDAKGELLNATMTMYMLRRI